jgi:hypothetical protein
MPWEIEYWHSGAKSICGDADAAGMKNDWLAKRLCMGYLAAMSQLVNRAATEWNRI